MSRRCFDGMVLLIRSLDVGVYVIRISALEHREVCHIMFGIHQH